MRSILVCPSRQEYFNIFIFKKKIKWNTNTVTIKKRVEREAQALVTAWRQVSSLQS